MWHIRMTKYRSTWQYYTENPLGGGFGSNHCGSQREALSRAKRNIPVGEEFTLTINGKNHGVQIA